MKRSPRILHCASEPIVFFGRNEELALLDHSLFAPDSRGEASVVALVGPGGQGKTAIVQHWLQRLPGSPQGVFFWSFYRGKDADHCLRHWLAYADNLPAPPEVSAAWCVERLLVLLRQERWAVVLDGAEVGQYEDGPWRGRFVHPDLGRLLEELASEPAPGVVVLTTRFPVPTLETRPFARIVALDRLDRPSARALLRSLGVPGEESTLDSLAHSAGRHAKAVELLATYLVHVQGQTGQSLPKDFLRGAPGQGSAEDDLDEETSVARVLSLYHASLPEPLQDIVALATTFRDPPTEALLLEYLASPAVARLLHGVWHRTYTPFTTEPAGWLQRQLDFLVQLRLLERVGAGIVPVIDAHPLVRRGFEHRAGSGHQSTALARAGFLRGRPDRRRPASLEEAREAIELFHAHCDAGLWTEADSALVGLENPKHRFLAPAVERDLLARFFPDGDWHRPPLWPGFGRWRSLAISLEMLGQFSEALVVYPAADAPLRGDALLALGMLQPLLDTPRVPAPWQTLWLAYRAHALSLAGRLDEAVGLARSLVPVDVYEWAHVFECLLRANRLDAVDLRSILYRAATDHAWGDLARRRMRADYLRRTDPGADLDDEYADLLVSHDRAGMPVERTLVRLSLARWLLGRGRRQEALALHAGTVELARQVPGLLVDVLEVQADLTGEEQLRQRIAQERNQRGIHGPARP